jgi:hypothetical protein
VFAGGFLLGFHECDKEAFHERQVYFKSNVIKEKSEHD